MIELFKNCVKLRSILKVLIGVSFLKWQCEKLNDPTLVKQKQVKIIFLKNHLKSLETVLI